MTVTPQQHRRAITLLSVAAFASAVSARLCDPMLPELARVFAASPTETAHVVSGFAIAYGVLQMFFGPLGDRVGKYRLIALTTLLCTLGAFGSALATGLDSLVLARALTGAAAAGIIPLSMAWIGDTVPYEARQNTLARFLSGQILGVIGGQFIGGVFADTLGWRWGFAFVSVSYLLVGALVLVESWRNPATRHTQPAGGQRQNMWRQMQKVFATPWARVIITTVFVEGTVVFGVLAFVPSYLHARFDVSLSLAGGLLGLFGVGGLSYILFAKIFVRRLGEAGLSLIGGGLLAVAWSLLAFGDAWGWALPACYCAGLGFYMLHNTLQTNATQMTPEVRGTAVSLFASAFFLGQALGAIVAANLMALFGGVWLLRIAALLIPLLGGVFAWLLQRRKRSLGL